MNKRGLLRFIAAAGLVTSTPIIVSGCFDQIASYGSIDVTGADYARDFQLPDQDGKTRSIKDFAGKVVVVFFGYTQCPDVCPTTMSELAEIRKLLGKDGERLQGVFITVDPQRDTAGVLKAYLGNFDTSFVALRPSSPEQLAALTKDFKVYFKKAQGPTATSYTMDHSAGSYVYDTRGQLRLYTRYGMGVQALAADIRQLLKQAP